MRASKVQRQSVSCLKEVLANNIREYRKLSGISQEDFADLCGLHRTYIGSVERSERNVTLGTLEVIASVIGVSVPQILTEGLMEHDGKDGC